MLGTAEYYRGAWGGGLCVYTRVLFEYYRSSGEAVLVQ